MFERLRLSIGGSLLGPIALGYLLARCVMDFANIFASPVSGWITRKRYLSLLANHTTPRGILLQDALPHLVRFLILLPVWYLLVRWVYIRPLREEIAGPKDNSEQTA